MEYYTTCRIGKFGAGQKVSVPGDIPEAPAAGHLAAGRLVTKGNVPADIAKNAVVKEEPVMGTYIALCAVGKKRSGDTLTVPEDIQDCNVQLLLDQGYIRNAYPCEIPGHVEPVKEPENKPEPAKKIATRKSKKEPVKEPAPEPEKEPEKMPEPTGIWTIESEELKDLSLSELKSILIQIAESNGINPDDLAVISSSKRSDYVEFLSSDTIKE